MIRNGLYSFETKALDGVVGGDSGVMVLRDGTIRGGTSFFYSIGTYSCSDGRWKGEMTVKVSWSRLSEQNFRVDKWSLCRG
jgi:hypothetical protein